jgi:hypothetical protein
MATIKKRVITVEIITDLLEDVQTFKIFSTNKLFKMFVRLKEVMACKNKCVEIFYLGLAEG